MEKDFDVNFYKKILDCVQSNIYITDTETDTIVYMNGYMKQTFQMEHPEGKTCWKTLQRGMTGRCPFCKIEDLKKAQKGKSCVWREKNTVTGKIYMNYDRLETWNGHTYYIQNCVDITDRLQLSMEASIDELTGVLNRNAGKKNLEEVLNGMKANDQFTVALYDINGLKWVNDTYGHIEGDRLLVFVAQNIQKELEESDFVFRLSGDEFIVCFMHKDLAQAETWMQKILKTLEERRIAGSMAYDVSFSYGLACIYGGESLSVSDVLSIADSQMYMRKRSHHIMLGRKRLEQEKEHGENFSLYSYDKNSLFKALSETIDDYLFMENLKSEECMYSYKMMMDFDLPGQVVADVATVWSEKIHPDDMELFLQSYQEIKAGIVERHTVAYRARNASGEWVHLLCRGRLVRDADGQPAFFAGIIRNLDRKNALPDVKKDVAPEIAACDERM